MVWFNLDSYRFVRLRSLVLPVVYLASSSCSVQGAHDLSFNLLAHVGGLPSLPTETTPGGDIVRDFTGLSLVSVQYGFNGPALHFPDPTASRTNVEENISAMNHEQNTSGQQALVSLGQSTSFTE